MFINAGSSSTTLAHHEINVGSPSSAYWDNLILVYLCLFITLFCHVKGKQQQLLTFQVSYCCLPLHYSKCQQITLNFQVSGFIFHNSISITLYYDERAETETDERHVDFKVNHTGGIFWTPQRVLKSACLIDVTQYPFDKHTCNMWFQFITYPSTQVTLKVRCF